MSRPSFVQPRLERILTLSTCITFMRIALVPCVVTAIAAESWGQVLILFGVAAITDVLDGMLARLRNEKTVFGACLDPIADKLLIISSVAELSRTEQLSPVIPAWFVWLMVSKELLLVSSVMLLYLWYGSVTIAPTRLAKLTTVAQVLFVMLLVTSYWCNHSLGTAYYVMLYGTSFMTIGSYLHYVSTWYQQKNHNRRATL
ncbi:CDP-alcohol phosphatidyltransferase family protein [Candidatus Dependentiae bacterium]|nr:CDP-alcohol phosphatidyltransferase family protein [Candidatus Dependentiae bacterium]MCC7415220.1 CDP-alcohol phosphatidyltransferase family protein [Campylobacterota bacterium]